MKKFYAILAAVLLLMPAVAIAQPAGCTWEGDPAFRYGWNYLDGLTFHQPGVDYVDIYAGQTLVKTVAPYNAHATWLPAGCKNADTLCFHAISKSGWAIVGDPPLGTPEELPGAGYLWYQDVYITAPCAVTLGQKDTVIAICAYVNNAGTCDPACGDCNDPNTRPTDGLFYYSRDTLVLTIVAAPPALGVFQDTLTLIERGQTQAYVPFTIANQDECDPGTVYNFSITSKGHIPMTVPATSINVVGGDFADVYAILNAGSATACTYDTLTIIVWVGTTYDTCVQVVHVVEPEPVPLFTVPVVTILVLALILAAAVFMRRRAAARA